MTTTPHVFISYKSEDYEFAFQLKQQIRDAGFNVWIDEERLRAGEDWREEIDQAIKESFALVLVITPESAESKYVIYEFARAWALGIKVIPIMLRYVGDKDFHPRLQGIQYEPFHNGVYDWDKLIRRLREVSGEYNHTIIYVPPNASPAIRNIVSGLNSLYTSERTQAVENLAQIADPMKIDILASAMQHSYQDVQINSAFQLSKFTDTRALPTIIKFLYGDNWDYKLIAANGLANLGESALAALWDALSHKDYRIRYHAARTLGQAGFNLHSESVPYLLSVLSNIDEDKSVRLAAAESLGEIKSSSAVDGLLRELEDTSSDIRSTVADVLSKIGDGRAVNPLMELFRKDKLDKVRKNIILALGHIGNDEAVKGLMEILDDEDSFVREFATQTLGKVKSKISVSRLIQALSDKDQDVRAYAATALAEIGDVDAIPAIIKAMHDHREWVRIAAANALQRFQTKEAIEALEEFKSWYASDKDTN